MPNQTFPLNAKVSVTRLGIGHAESSACEQKGLSLGLWTSLKKGRSAVFTSVVYSGKEMNKGLDQPLT